ncbi:hypothetical protein ACET3Z_008856 [Daucus carota]
MSVLNYSLSLLYFIVDLGYPFNFAFSFCVFDNLRKPVVILRSQYLSELWFIRFQIKYGTFTLPDSS